MTSTVIFQIQSFLIMCLLIFGATKSKNRSLHVKMMATGMIWDILLILQIELTRSAIAKASKIITNPMMLKIHLFFAIGSVILYVLMALSGKKLLSGDNSQLAKHRILGRTTLIFRVMTFITSFWAAS